MTEELDRVLQTRAGGRVECLSITWTSLGSDYRRYGRHTRRQRCFDWIRGRFNYRSNLELRPIMVAGEGSIDRDRAAHRLVGACFFALAAYIAIDASADLLIHEAPRVTYFGILYAGACVVVMPLLARAKRRVAVRLNSNALHADSHQSDICAYLSVILLLGLALNAALGWWWADPIAALCMLPIIIREGIAGWCGKTCSHAHF